MQRAKDQFSAEFNEWYDSSGLNLPYKEKNNLRSAYRSRWNCLHKRGEYNSFEDILDYNYVNLKMIRSFKKLNKSAIPPNTPIHLRRKYDSLFQSFLGDLPQDTFDDDLLNAFNYWKEHMSEQEASHFAAIDVLYSYRYIGPETAKMLQYKRTLNIGVQQWIGRKE